MELLSFGQKPNVIFSVLGCLDIESEYMFRLEVTDQKEARQMW